jgi:hypothetical protein
MGGTTICGGMSTTGTSNRAAEVAAIAASPCCPPSSSFVAAAACHSHHIMPMACVNARVLSAVNLLRSRAAERPGCRHSSIPLRVLRRAEVRMSTSDVPNEPARARSFHWHTLYDSTGLCASARVSAASNVRHPARSAYLTGSGCCRDQSDGANARGGVVTGAAEGRFRRVRSYLRAMKCARARQGASPRADLSWPSRSQLRPLPCRLSSSP